jgi:hypothetical protein
MRGLSAAIHAPLIISDPMPSMTASNAGEVFITDASGWRIVRLKSDGSVGSEIKLPSPQTKIIGKVTNGFYLLDRLDRGVYFYNWWGERLSSLSLGSDDYALGTVSSLGQLYLSRPMVTGIDARDNEGVLVRTISPAGINRTLQSATSLAVTSDASLMAIADAVAGKVYLCNGYGQFISSTKTAISRSPSAVCFARNSNILWLCDQEGGMVRSYRATVTGLQQSDSLKIPSPKAITEGPYGSLFVAGAQHVWEITIR